MPLEAGGPKRIRERFIPHPKALCALRINTRAQINPTGSQRG